jgi:putative FmdB family regulatory protein
MPMYVYACESCASRREVRHGINDRPPTQCPACGGVLERVLTVPRVNAGNYSSPTAARYAKMTAAEEVAHARTELEARERRPPDQTA